MLNALYNFLLQATLLAQRGAVAEPVPEPTVISVRREQAVTLYVVWASALSGDIPESRAAQRAATIALAAAGAVGLPAGSRSTTIAQASQMSPEKVGGGDWLGGGSDQPGAWSQGNEAEGANAGSRPKRNKVCFRSRRTTLSGYTRIHVHAGAHIWPTHSAPGCPRPGSTMQYLACRTSTWLRAGQEAGRRLRVP